MRDYHSLFSILVAPPIFVLAAKDRPVTTRGLLVSFSEVLLAFPPDSDFELPVYQGNSPVLLVFYLFG